MKKIILAVAMAAILGSGGAARADITGTVTQGAEVGRDVSGGTDIGQNGKQGRTISHGDGTSITNSNGWSRDRNASTSFKQMADAKRANELSVTINASVLLATDIMTYERNPALIAKYPKKKLLAVIQSARYSHPVLAAQIGITGQVMPGVFSDQIDKLHDSAGRNNDLIEDVVGLRDHANLVRQTMKELIVLGAIGSQAIYYAQADISLLKSELPPAKKFVETRKTKGDAEALKGITGEALEVMGAGDMEGIFWNSLDRVLTSGITKESLQKRTNAALAAVDGDCHYRVATGNKSVICGGVEWNIGSAPNITVGGTPWISATGFGGLEASYRVSGAWSYSEMFDKMNGIGSSSKVSHDFSGKVDDSVTRTRGREFLINAKTAVNRKLGATGSRSVGNK